jgi:transcriptional regulator with XRE-family HTH domain
MSHTILLGSKERVSEFLNRKRGLSLEMIRKLHEGLGIPADLLIGQKSQNGAAPVSPHIHFAGA